MAKNKAKKTAAPGPEGTHCDACKTTTAEPLVEVKGPHGISHVCPSCKKAHDLQYAHLRWPDTAPAAETAPAAAPAEDEDLDEDQDDEDGDDEEDDGEEESDDQAAGGAGGGEETP